jgi:ribonuclease HI
MECNADASFRRMASVAVLRQDDCQGVRVNDSTFAELLAILFALRWRARLDGAQKTGTGIRIKTDSEPAIWHIESHLGRRPGIGASNNAAAVISYGPILDAIAFEVALAKAFGIKVDFQHVKGHSGTPGNEVADALAKQGRCRPRTALTLSRQHSLPLVPGFRAAYIDSSSSSIG